MFPRHVAALALVGWYLMRPPLPHLNTHAVHKDTAAALRGWKMVRRFPTQKECRPTAPTRGNGASPPTTRASRKNSDEQAARGGGSALRLSDHTDGT
jgi:hypothetical protein